jgi:hypothetical protein
LEAKRKQKKLRKRRTKCHGRRKKKKRKRNGERIMLFLQFHGPLSLMNERAPAEKEKEKEESAQWRAAEKQGTAPERIAVVGSHLFAVSLLQYTSRARAR